MNDKETNVSQESLEKRIQESREKFDQNLSDFKSKKLIEVPCFRSTFLTSIPVGLVLGLFSYLFTNKVKLASNVAMGSYLLVSAGYFANCRLEFNKKVSQNKELGDIMNLIIKYRGTELEEQFQKKYKEKLEEIDSKSKYV
ncbi:cytochrome c oxidase 20 -like protein [Brachionus plicatilis]|uniref:Cytochrome c oxidase assembly protein COX20, mitochondrial n=1 Tax=Brachionus plicatilis TaxID=10195 RepID=A0A3M7RZ73_BRAPC|nr:cytochrome c oxidase 20 -like protein [Brachionus plicatilis]RNA28861.1 cytochrome c oxidase 20 -like protein [Brachionus plicatilis]